MNKLSKSDLSYIAGIIDGEGCITILKRKRLNEKIFYILSLSIGNTEIKLLKWILKNVGGHICKRPTQYKKYYRRYWIWTMYANNVASLLNKVMPYLIIKSKQAKIAISFQKHITDTDRRGKCSNGGMPTHYIQKREKYLLKITNLHSSKGIYR